MGAIFLSASVPISGRPGYDSASPFLIREAVSALVEVVLGRRLLVWGGHPAITPMIWAAAEGLGVDYGKSVRLFQSQFFEDQYPEDNKKFKNVTFIQRGRDLQESLSLMRTSMLTAYSYEAAVFIGGMEGIREEFEIFKRYAPRGKLLPVYTPGGVARELFEQTPNIPHDFKFAIDYSAWFYNLLRIKTIDERTLDASGV